MSAAHNQGKIVAISGKIIAVAVDGSQRVLKVGDTVAVGERLIVPADGVIELRADNGNIVKIAEARDLTITDDVFGPATADVADAALATLPSEAQQVLTALQDGQDPLQNLEATAAGLAAGGGEDGGSSYTILGRVSEDITAASLAAGTASDANIDTIAATTGALDATQTLNQPSVLVADSNFIDEDGMAAGNLLENDSDTDDALSVVGITVNDRTFTVDTEEGAFIELESGVLQVSANGDYIFSPASNWNGTVPVITYTTNTGSSSTLTITVNPVDDPSVLKADSNTVEEDTPAKGNVLENDSDIDSELSVVSITVDGRSYTVDAQDGAFVELESGMLEVSANGDYIFTPASNWHGTVPTVAYTTNTGSSSTLDITVTPVTDGFTDGNESVSVAEDTTLQGSVLDGTSSVDGAVRVTGFSIGDSSYAAGASASIDGVGSLQLNADGSYLFTPAANYHGAVPLVSYTVSDGVSSDSSTLSISVTPVTDGFTDGNESVSVAE
ncbi:retention module-containing protein, partial [Vogesella indigofera]|uniref:retention module-containing protein n=1 Tax=Vogesella indigofera TaxID=45465 RepID=UPI00234F5939